MSKTAKKSMKGIVVTIDCFEDTNPGESVAGYEENRECAQGGL